MTTFEYRKFFRADVVLKVEYRTIKAPILNGIAFSKNLSQTGISIVASDEFMKDTELELKIYIDDKKKPLTATGMVVWQSECSFVPESKREYFVTGIQLNDMSPEDAIVGSDFVRDFLVKKSQEQNEEIIEKIEELR